MKTRKDHQNEKYMRNLVWTQKASHTDSRLFFSALSL